MTTRDASVTDVVNGRVLLVKVQDGFTQEESLSYLANCLNISEEELPEQADQIYSESKGNVQKCFDSRFSTGEPIDEIKIECNFNMKKKLHELQVLLWCFHCWLHFWQNAENLRVLILVDGIIIWENCAIGNTLI